MAVHGACVLSFGVGAVSVSPSGTIAKPADVMFAQMMANHEGAVEMATTEVGGGTNADAVVLAKGIVAPQETEIKAMKHLPAAL
ncbi:DUF305 domain-containing protein [Arthrobacter wenxiniae]|uniref:DUF305 domain-containing protein n=1 Tax=Arthrobacter wenxiniae TaxID=2713570 RepID=A0A7Y7IJE0_9MICC|nr:DUF305 domain-containing protein [Arthrobacter wenxiniae]NVM96561.1 DUF305 domain-containing protein [Arthrobacter wenxiniae]